MRTTTQTKHACGVHWLAAAVLACIMLAPARAQDDDAGGFDINKVREAVEQNRIVAGDSAMAGTETTETIEDNMGLVIARIVGWLAVVIVLIVVVFWVLRRIGMVGASRVGGGTMDMLEALPLGQGRNIIIVRVMDAVLVLGQTSQQITLLETIEGEKALEIIASSKGGTSIVQFKDMFNSFMGKMKKSSQES
ncbi:MAG: flagellar biosynthetic protein FliO [Chitinivibrionales bacterium]|nr:flagellar biosynthetic protein FliO [Chitinivibrionales bacterium]MBD3394027.1 flagellar biosynthetic protein FliO [Chitinivibrionales bacterium]